MAAGRVVFRTWHGTALEPQNLTRMWTELCLRRGMRAVPLHGLRHTCVSLLLARGIHPRVVMEIVGHSAMEMTMNVYGHVNLDDQREALDELDEQCPLLSLAAVIRLSEVAENALAWVRLEGFEPPTF